MGFVIRAGYSILITDPESNVDVEFYPIRYVKEDPFKVHNELDVIWLVPLYALHSPEINVYYELKPKTILPVLAKGFYRVTLKVYFVWVAI